MRHSDRVPAAILFGDMKGSTGAAEREEFEAVAQIREYLHLIESTVRSYSPRYFKVKSESDGFMARFSNAHVMVECGIALKAAFRDRGWQVRLGGSYVEAFEEPEGDLLGADMNRCARIASASDPEACQFLVSDAVPPVVRGRLEGIVFEQHGEVHAKGISDGLPVFEVLASSETSVRNSQREKYLEAVVRMHQWIDLGGLAPQVGTELLRIGLDDLFVPISAYRKMPQLDSYARHDIRIRREADELPSNPAETEQRLRALSEQVDLRYSKTDDPDKQHVPLSALTDQTRNVVLGDPGAGKTTLLRYIARRVALGKALDGDAPTLTAPWLNMTPVYVRVGEFATHLQKRSSTTLEEFISSGAGQYCVAIDRGFLEREVSSGRCLFLFDGLDEVVDTKVRQQVREHIHRFAETHTSCTFIVTSRIVGYREVALPSDQQGFSHFTLRPFDNEDVLRFLRQWYGAIAATGQLTDPARQNAERLAQGIRRHPSVHRLATNPLLMTLIALIYWREVKLPRRRIELYRSAADTLLDKWRQVGLDFRETTSILMSVAFHMHSTSGMGLITRTDLERLVIAMKVDPQRGGRTQLDAERETSQFLRLIGEQSGILYPRGTDERGVDVFGFMHLTFEEYFAAREFARRWRQRSLQLRDYVHLPRWREIILLASAHLSDEDDEVASDGFVREIRDAKSPFESTLRRDLLLAADCLADDAVTRSDLRVRIFADLEQAFTTTIVPLNSALSNTLAGMSGSRVVSDAVSLAMAKLHADNPWVKSAALRAITALGERASTPQVLREIIVVAADSRGNVKSSAAKAIAAVAEHLPSGDIEAVLVDLAQSAEPERRAAAAEAVGALGEAIVTPLLLEVVAASMRDAEIGVRSAGAKAAGALGVAAATPTVIDALIPLLQDEANGPRWSAVYAIGALGKATATPAILDRVFELTRDDVPEHWPDGFIDEAAIPEFLIFGGDPPYRGVLVEWAKGRVKVLGEHAAPPEILARIAVLLRDADVVTRQAGAEAIIALTGAVRTDDVLAMLAESDYPDVRRAAGKYIAAKRRPVATPSVVSTLAALLGDADPSVRAAAVHAVGALGEDGVTAELVETIVQLLNDPDTRVQSSATWALALVGGYRPILPKTISHLVRLAGSADQISGRLITTAVAALGNRLGFSGVVVATLENLEQGSPAARVGACRVIRELGERVATPEIVTLLGMALRSGGTGVRSAAAEAIASLGERAATPEILDELATILARKKDSDLLTSAARATATLGAAAATTKMTAALGAVIEAFQHKGTLPEDAAFDAQKALAPFCSVPTPSTSIQNEPARRRHPPRPSRHK